MGISPETLEEETFEQRKERERRTGVLGNGLHVLCFPVLGDPGITQVQDRLVCLTTPYQSCRFCQHGRFTLFFDADPVARLQVVQCPRWETAADRLVGKSPLEYVSCEIATCESRRFEYCPSCPSQKELVQIGADKQVPGWYGRWERIQRDRYSGDQDE